MTAASPGYQLLSGRTSGPFIIPKIGKTPSTVVEIAVPNYQPKRQIHFTFTAGTAELPLQLPASKLYVELIEIGSDTSGKTHPRVAYQQLFRVRPGEEISVSFCGAYETGLDPAFCNSVKLMVRWYTDGQTMDWNSYPACLNAVMFDEPQTQFVPVLPFQISFFTQTEITVPTGDFQLLSDGAHTLEVGQIANSGIVIGVVLVSANIGRLNWTPGKATGLKIRLRDAASPVVGPGPSKDKGVFALQEFDYPGPNTMIVGAFGQPPQSAPYIQVEWMADAKDVVLPRNSEVSLTVIQDLSGLGLGRSYLGFQRYDVPNETTLPGQFAQFASVDVQAPSGGVMQSTAYVGDLVTPGGSGSASVRLTDEQGAILTSYSFTGTVPVVCAAKYKSPAPPPLDRAAARGEWRGTGTAPKLPANSTAFVTYIFDPNAKL